MFSFRNSSVSNVSVSFAAGNIPVHSQQFVESTGIEIDFSKSSTNAFIILLYFILCAGLSFAFAERFKKAFANKHAYEFRCSFACTSHSPSPITPLKSSIVISSGLLLLALIIATANPASTHGFPVQLNNGMITSGKNNSSNSRNRSNSSSRKSSTNRASR